MKFSERDKRSHALYDQLNEKVSSTHASMVEFGEVAYSPTC